ncbi:MAG: M20/M25/M40 family metallo-hydrolase [Acidobacteriota bacterium]
MGDRVNRPLERLQAYLQVDTVDRTEPAAGERIARAREGSLAGERAAAEMLAGWLAEGGIASRRLESPTGNSLLWAELPATVSPPSGIAPPGAVLMLHHLDVVPADADAWSVTPFSGRAVGGELWGRGALDIKSLGIAHLEAMLALADDPAPRARPLVFLAAGGEETGGQGGVGWAVEAHPELFDDVAVVLNEGGSNRVVRDRLVWWGIEVVQKRPLWLRLRARGPSGHGSLYRPNSAGHRLIRALTRALELPLVPRVTAAARTSVAAAAEAEGIDVARRLRELEAAARGEPSGLPVGFVAMLRDTLQIGRVQLADRVNVIAGRPFADLDLRLLPDTDAEAVRETLARLVGPDIEIETLLAAPTAAPSPIDHPAYAGLREVLETRAPVVPMFLLGTTDSRWFRERGIPAYGFTPFTVESDTLVGIHGIDERLEIDELRRGIEVMRRVVRRLVVASDGGWSGGYRPADSSGQ